MNIVTGYEFRILCGFHRVFFVFLFHFYLFFFLGGGMTQGAGPVGGTYEKDMHQSFVLLWCNVHYAHYTIFTCNIKIIVKNYCILKCQTIKHLVILIPIKRLIKLFNNLKILTDSEVILNNKVTLIVFSFITIKTWYISPSPWVYLIFFFWGGE